jgi:hypothetical protein
MPQKEAELWKELAAKRSRDFERHVLWGEPIPERTPEQQLRDRLKYAYVFIGDKRTMLMVDNEKMTGYKLNDTNPGLYEPLTEVVYDRFERWCRMMDL